MGHNCSFTLPSAGFMVFYTVPVYKYTAVPINTLYWKYTIIKYILLTTGVLLCMTINMFIKKNYNNLKSDHHECLGLNAKPDKAVQGQLELCT